MECLKHRISRIALSLLIMTAVGLILSACEKWSHNGDIDGQWQVMEVSYAGDTVEFPEGEKFYYNFYLHTVQLGTVGIRPRGLEGNMIYEGNRLSLEFPYIEEKKLPSKWMDRLIYWGVPAGGVIDATIQELTSSRLVFKYADVVVTCRKF